MVLTSQDSRQLLTQLTRTNRSNLTSRRLDYEAKACYQIQVKKTLVCWSIYHVKVCCDRAGSNYDHSQKHPDNTQGMAFHSTQLHVCRKNWCTLKMCSCMWQTDTLVLVSTWRFRADNWPPATLITVEQVRQGLIVASHERIVTFLTGDSFASSSTIPFCSIPNQMCWYPCHWLATGWNVYVNNTSPVEWGNILLMVFCVAAHSDHTVLLCVVTCKWFLEVDKWYLSNIPWLLRGT